jgi:hypothetical protein
MADSRALLLLVVAAAVAGLAAANFRDDCDIPWEPQNAWLSDDGNSLSMRLVSNYSGPSSHTQMVKWIHTDPSSTSTDPYVTWHGFICRLHAPDKETVRLRDRVHPNPARPGQLGRHRHHVLRTSSQFFLLFNFTA